MNYILCRNRVRNFDYWKGVFDSHADAHRAAGLKLVHLWYELTSPRNVFFLFEAENLERARAFFESPDASDFARASGLIEGDVRYFGHSLDYGLLNEEESRAMAAAMQSEPATSSAPNPAPANAAGGSVSPQPMSSAEPQKSAQPPSAEPQKGPAPSAPATATAPASTQPNATEPAKTATPPAAMKGPERAKNAPPLEVVDGWQPVENWPPAEAAAEAEREAPQPRRGRWMRSKY